MFVFVGVTIVVNKYHHPKEGKMFIWGRKGFIWFKLSHRFRHYCKSGHKLKQGLSLEVGTDPEAMKGFCLLICLLIVTYHTFIQKLGLDTKGCPHS